MGIIIKSDIEIDTMRQAGRIVAEILQKISERVRPGVKTKELDMVAATELEIRRVTSSFKGYHGFPANLCVSVNDEIVHGIPGERVLREGDIVSLDFGVIYEGFQLPPENRSRMQRRDCTHRDDHRKQAGRDDSREDEYRRVV